MILFSKDFGLSIKNILKIITHNFWLKFLSLVFAFVLFFIVRTDKEIIFEKTLRVKIVTLSNMTVIGSDERYLTASIRMKNAFFSIPPTENELTGEIDVTDSNPGKISIKVTKDNFPRLSKSYFLFIEKPYIEVDLDRLIERTLPIKAVILGQPGQGFSVSNIKISPENVLFSGASRELDKLESMNTVPISIDGIKETLTTDALLDVDGKNSVKSKTRLVNVSINVSKK